MQLFLTLTHPDTSAVYYLSHTKLLTSFIFSANIRLNRDTSADRGLAGRSSGSSPTSGWSRALAEPAVAGSTPAPVGLPLFREKVVFLFLTPHDTFYIFCLNRRDRGRFCLLGDSLYLVAGCLLLEAKC